MDFIPSFCSPAALKKAFSEDTEIQSSADEEFVVLNLVVSQKSAEQSHQSLDSAKVLH